MGAVFAAKAANVIPEVERIGPSTGTMGGFVAGRLVMIGLKWATVMLFLGFLVLLALKLNG